VRTLQISSAQLIIAVVRGLLLLLWLCLRCINNGSIRHCGVGY